MAKSQQKPKVSLFFSDLYNRYQKELEIMSKDMYDPERKIIFDKTLAERRKMANIYFKCMSHRPEFAAPLFYGIFNFGKGAHSLMDVLLTSNGSVFSKPQIILSHVTLESGMEKMLGNIPRSGSERFLSIVLGLEYLRMQRGDLFATEIRFPYKDLGSNDRSPYDDDDLFDSLFPDGPENGRRTYYAKFFCFPVFLSINTKIYSFRNDNFVCFWN